MTMSRKSLPHLRPGHVVLRRILILKTLADELANAPKGQQQVRPRRVITQFIDQPLDVLQRF